MSHSTPRRKGAFERTPVGIQSCNEYESPTAKRRRVHLDMMLTTEFDLNTPQVSESSIAFNLLDTESDLSICSTSTYSQSTVSEKWSSQLSSTSQLLSSVCCELRCLASLSLLEVEGCQKNFQSRSNIEQQQFLLDAISLTASKNDLMLILSGKQLCKVAFAKVLGISEKRLRKVSKLYLEGATLSQQSCQVKKSKSTKHSSALAWMECYFDRIGDKMPHLQQIHLPHFLSRKTVYELMVQDLLDEGLSRQEIISKSHFYAVWREEFRNCIIPKVCFYCMLCSGHATNTATMKYTCRYVTACLTICPCYKMCC